MKSFLLLAVFAHIIICQTIGQNYIAMVATWNKPFIVDEPISGELEHHRQANIKCYVHWTNGMAELNTLEKAEVAEYCFPDTLPSRGNKVPRFVIGAGYAWFGHDSYKARGFSFQVDYFDKNNIGGVAEFHYIQLQYSNGYHLSLDTDLGIIYREPQTFLTGSLGGSFLFACDSEDCAKSLGLFLSAGWMPSFGRVGIHPEIQFRFWDNESEIEIREFKPLSGKLSLVVFF